MHPSDSVQVETCGKSTTIYIKLPKRKPLTGISFGEFLAQLIRLCWYFAFPEALHQAWDLV